MDWILYASLLLLALFIVQRLWPKKLWNPEGKVIIITGASSGIGRHTAQKLATQKAKLVLTARRAKQLEEVVAECTAAGCEAIAVEADVGVYEQCKKVIDSAISRFGRIDALILNAGISMSDLFEDLTDAKSVFEQIMQTNFYQVVYMSELALPHLKATKGRIVGISTLAALANLPGRSAYVASKCAMDGFLSVLRNEVQQKYGITVTVIFPGVVATDINRTRLGPEGKVGTSKTELDTTKGISAEEAGRKVVSALLRGVRDDVWIRGALFLKLLKVLAPSVADWIATRTFAKMTKNKDKTQ